MVTDQLESLRGGEPFKSSFGYSIAGDDIGGVTGRARGAAAETGTLSVDSRPGREDGTGEVLPLSAFTFSSFQQKLNRSGLCLRERDVIFFGCRSQAIGG